ncbi:prepilin peptidase dependent protein B [Nicoletella semolina]|uniref:Prepilin peptidase dependent protein B n=1 Tax=Nicoletella semolina TaxID=271160 RepID=A0A4R2N8V1_9PAST|nr:hypothetical protein [Nicoletella semolina]MDH2924449.1 hypothetical protein [Nicoletella semolina]TCP17427.1 prepilin peptidase dependent protein B [Nicoletella semolina]
MLFKRIKNQAVVKSLHSFTLIEVLITTALSTFILLFAARLFSDFYYMQNKQRELFNLQSHSYHILAHLQQHIQHIGYQGSFREKSNIHLFLNNKSYSLNSSYCLMFYYDLNGDGCIGERRNKNQCTKGDLNITNDVSKEFFGFKLKNKAIYIYEDDSIKKCSLIECQKLLRQCNQGKWRGLSEYSDINVEHLKFTIIKNNLIKIDLIISSHKHPNIYYESSAYSYLFN